MARPATAPRSRRHDNRRRLSQNFLTDPRIAAALVRLSGVGRDDFVIEVGPGDGILTRQLARHCGRLLCYELDAALAQRVKQLYRDDPRVDCLHQDFLTAQPPSREFSLVANIPYARTAAIVDWCLRATRLGSATLLTQLEYARKRSGDYGRWSRTTVASWPQFEWRLCGRVDRRKFHPVPKVDSGILRLVRRAEPLLPDWSLRDYREFVDLGFTGLGGNLFTSLRRRYPRRLLARTFDALELDTRVVVGYVTPRDWIELYGRLERL